MAGKKKVMSLSIDPDLHEKLKIAKKRSGYDSVSAILCDLATRHLDLVVKNGDEIPVILRVPSELRGDGEALQEWFSKKTKAIVESLSKS
ncbi:MAG: hypothetical protein ACW99G_03050 [Candidatus Thorarchaeota archaeon]